METFVYNDNDFIFNISCTDQSSPFDEKLQSKWTEKQEKGVFRYKLNIAGEKHFSDKFYLQLNVNRATHRRTPEEVQPNQPFDPTKFNFTKIKEDEKLFYLSHETKTTNDYKHLVAVNVSPVEYGHVLLIPNLYQNLPQILTEDSIRISIEMMLLSGTSYFRIGFNSQGAFATVNHLHIHGYYLKRKMYLERAPVEIISHPCHRLTNFPSKGFVFQIRTVEEIDFIVKNVYKLVEFMQKSNISHNLYITRGSPFDADIDDTSCLRIYVWPRRPSFGAKTTSNLNPATCELFGHLVIKNETDFYSLDEKQIINILEDLTGELFETVMKDIFTIFPL